LLQFPGFGPVELDDAGLVAIGINFDCEVIPPSIEGDPDFNWPPAVLVLGDFIIIQVIPVLGWRV